MTEPIPENVEQILTGLAYGVLARHEAVAWGEAVYQRWGAPLPGIIDFKTNIIDIAEEKLTWVSPAIQ